MSQRKGQGRFAVSALLPAIAAAALLVANGCAPSKTSPADAQRCTADCECPWALCCYTRPDRLVGGCGVCAGEHTHTFCTKSCECASGATCDPRGCCALPDGAIDNRPGKICMPPDGAAPATDGGAAAPDAGGTPDGGMAAAAGSFSAKSRASGPSHKSPRLARASACRVCMPGTEEERTQQQ